MARATRRKVERAQAKPDRAMMVEVPLNAQPKLLIALDAVNVARARFGALSEGVALSLGIDYDAEDWQLTPDAKAYVRIPKPDAEGKVVPIEQGKKGRKRT